MFVINTFKKTPYYPSSSINVGITIVTKNVYMMRIFIVIELDNQLASIVSLIIIVLLDPFYTQISLSKTFCPKLWHSWRVMGTMASIHRINFSAYLFIRNFFIFIHIVNCDLMHIFFCISILKL